MQMVAAGFESGTVPIKIGMLYPAELRDLLFGSGCKYKSILISDALLYFTFYLHAYELLGTKRNLTGFLNDTSLF